ncbi:MAG TPA: pilus assembly protein TadG-related protein [Roseomonas sp.]
MTARRPLKALPRERGGAVVILVALAFTLLIGAVALATDVGVLQWQKRRLQAAVDVAALSAARAPAERQAQRAVEAVTENGFSTATVTTRPGGYLADPAVAVASRFVAGSVAPAAVPAVEVRAEIDAGVTLMRLFTGAATTRIAARSVAAYQPQSAFTIGSGLLAVNTGDSALLNPLLGGLLGTSLSLTAVDYNGLLGARVMALAFLDRLAIAANLTAGNYDSLLESTIGAGTLLNAAANALSPNDAQVAARNTLLALAAAVGNNRTLRLGDLLNLGGNGSQPIGSLGDDVSYATLGLSAYDLLAAAAAVGGRDNVVQLGAILNIPGVQVNVSLRLIEPPVAAGDDGQSGHIALGPVGIRARTSQVRLTLGIKLLNFNVLGLASTAVNLPVMVEAAWATGTLTSLSCDAQPSVDTAMTVAVTTGAISVGLGSGSATAPQPARLVNLSLLFGILPVLTIDGSAGLAIGQGSGNADFTAAQIAAGTPQRVSVNTGTDGKLLSRLINTLTLQPTLLGILPFGTVVDDVTEALTSAIEPMLDKLDPLLIGLLNALGVTLGYADVRPSAARCGAVALAQ